MRCSKFSHFCLTLRNVTPTPMHQLLTNIPHKTICVPAKTTLLQEGDISTKVFLIKSGCARLWTNDDGKEITLQFFMPRQPVASFDSLLNGTPSKFSLETIFDTELDIFDKSDIETALNTDATAQRRFLKIAFEVANKYVQLFLSRISNSPQQRYEQLLKEHPEIVSLIPQHYIASYLGITAVSLSRIRNRIAKS